MRIFKSLFMVTVVMLLSGQVFADKGLSASDKAKYRVDIQSGCVTGVTKSRNGNKFKQDKIRSYCACYAAKLVNILTVREVQYMEKNRKNTAAFQSSILSAAKSCARKLLPE